jgi:hypothetical protein
MYIIFLVYYFMWSSAHKITFGCSVDQIRDFHSFIAGLLRWWKMYRHVLFSYSACFQCIRSAHNNMNYCRISDFLLCLYESLLFHAWNAQCPRGWHRGFHLPSNCQRFYRGRVHIKDRLICLLGISHWNYRLILTRGYSSMTNTQLCKSSLLGVIVRLITPNRDKNVNRVC